MKVYVEDGIENGDRVRVIAEGGYVATSVEAVEYQDFSLDGRSVQLSDRRCHRASDDVPG